MYKFSKPLLHEGNIFEKSPEESFCLVFGQGRIDICLAQPNGQKELRASDKTLQGLV